MDDGTSEYLGPLRALPDLHSLDSARLCSYQYSRAAQLGNAKGNQALCSQLLVLLTHGICQRATWSTLAGSLTRCAVSAVDWPSLGSEKGLRASSPCQCARLGYSHKAAVHNSSTQKSRTIDFFVTIGEIGEWKKSRDLKLQHMLHEGYLGYRVDFWV
jgi:hypothetical protein